MIIIISSSTDIHATAVLEQLRSMDQSAVLLDLSNFPANSRLSMNFANQTERTLALEVPGGDSIDFGDVRSVWWRRPQQFMVDPELRDPANAEFALNESCEAVTGLWQVLDTFWMNVPYRDTLAHRKVYQLDVAQQLGIPIPETLISNDPSAVKQFLDRHNKVICKSFSATESHWRETRLVGDAEIRNLESVRFAPVIFQEYIEAQYDLRITLVGNDIFPAAIYSQETEYPVDCRMDLAAARIAVASLPKKVESQLRNYMHKLGLVYGAIDMRLQPDGTYVFLEINPAGQFLFIEEVTKQPITQSIANCLSSSGNTQIMSVANS